MIIEPKFKVPPEYAMYCVDKGEVTRMVQFQRTKQGADTPTGDYSYVPPSSSACTAQEIAPTADTSTDNWLNELSSTPLYTSVNGVRGSENLSTYIWEGDASAERWDTLRFAMPGGCNVNKVVVYVNGNCAPPAKNIGVNISKDNSNWEGQKSFLIPVSRAEVSDIWTVSWTAPTYCYVSVGTLAGDTYDTIYLVNIAIRINDP